MSAGRRIGARRHRLRLERPIASDDGLGGADIAWAEVATVFAAIEPAAMREAVEAGRTDGLVTHRITIRHRENVRGGGRFSLGERSFAIRVVRDPDESGRFLECLCEEGGR